MVGGASTVTLTISGTLTMGSGGLILNNGATAVSVTGGTLAFGANPIYLYGGGNGASTLAVASLITGTAGLTKFGPATVTLSAASNPGLTGGIFLNGGTLATAAEFTLGPVTNPLTFNGGALSITPTTAVTLTATHPITLNAQGGTFIAAGVAATPDVVAGEITGAGALTVSNPATGVLSLAPAVVISSSDRINSNIITVTSTAGLAVGADLQRPHRSRQRDNQSDHRRHPLPRLGGRHGHGHSGVRRLQRQQLRRWHHGDQRHPALQRG